MKNPTDDDAYDVLFRSYELANKEIKELQAQLAYEQERNLNNVSNADLQIAELQAEITRLCEQFRRAGGCARDQHTTQYCGELQALVGRLTALAEEFQTEETWDGKRNDALRYCAGRLREAISGEGEQQVGLLEIADDVIAEREAADQKWADMRYGGEGER